MRRVLVGTPSYDGKVDVRFADSLMGSTRLCWQAGIDLRAIYLSYDASLPNARNSLVALALKNGFSDLIFIDADQDWEPAWVPKLLAYPVDCVGAAVRKKTDEREMYNVRVSGGVAAMKQDRNTGLWTAPDMSVGTGFLRVTCTALRKLWDAAEKYTDADGRVPMAWIFEMRPEGGRLVSEDTFLCDKLRAIGIAVWVDPDMNPGHTGMKHFEGNFRGYIQGLMNQK